MLLKPIYKRMTMMLCIKWLLTKALTLAQHSNCRINTKENYSLSASQQKLLNRKLLKWRHENWTHNKQLVFQFIKVLREAWQTKCAFNSETILANFLFFSVVGFFSKLYLRFHHFQSLHVVLSYLKTFPNRSD